VIPGISPGSLLEVMENPDAFPEIARADLYVQMHVMRERGRQADMPNSQRLDYMKFLARMGKVEAGTGAADSLAGVPTINIVMPGTGQTVSIGVSPQKSSVAEAPTEKEVGPIKQSTAVIP